MFGVDIYKLLFQSAFHFMKNEKQLLKKIKLFNAYCEVFHKQLKFSTFLKQPKHLKNGNNFSLSQVKRILLNLVLLTSFKNIIHFSFVSFS